MGVLGFAPFLQKQFPEVFRELPQRLKSLSGKTIAIDGTLITQRLHFAPIPYENRHVLGWYNLVRELKECGVGVICVFDGEERSLAKQLETERRRKAQRMDVARGAMEIERSHRLRRLTTLLKQYRVLPEPEKDRATKTLQSIVLTSHETRETRGPFREIALDTDAGVLPLSNELSARELFPSTSRIGSPSITLLPDGQIASLRPGSRNVPNETQEPSLNRTSKNQDLEAGLQTLEDVLPKYFTARDNPLVTEPEKIHDTSPQKNSNDDVSLEEDHFIKSFPSYRTPRADDVQTSIVDAREPMDRLSNLTTEPANDSTDISKDATPSSEDIRSPHNEVIASQDVEIADTPDDSVFNPPTKIFDPFQYTAEAVEGPSLPPEDDSKEILATDDNYELVPPQENGSGEPTESVVSSTDIEIVEAEPSVEVISRGLLSLYQDYQESVPTFMAPPILEPPIEVSVMSEEVRVGVQEQYMMSRNQIQLTLDEGNLWDSLVRPDAPALDNPENTLTEEKLESLAQKSDIITRSYEKRNNPPTQKTYDECKLILRTMGVPCIDSVGPYEAEALAASLVHHGFADYVASEDTDVLVYEAPLLRGLANRQSPITLLSGTEVREALQLDRASYVDFALLLGTDFSQRIKNLGPHRAIKLIRTHGRIEHVIANEPKFVPRMPTDVYLKQVEVARLVFETLPPVPDSETLLASESDDEAVVALLQKFGVYRAAAVDWDFSSALDGNYFGDNPAAVA